MGVSDAKRVSNHCDRLPRREMTEIPTHGHHLHTDTTRAHLTLCTRYISNPLSMQININTTDTLSMQVRFPQFFVAFLREYRAITQHHKLYFASW